MRTEGNTRKTIEEEEESMFRKTVKYLRRWSAEARKESEETQEVVEVDVEEAQSELE